MAVYHANMMPVPNDTNRQPVDRKAAMEAVKLAEMPAEALARRARGEGPPAHYTPTPPAAGGPIGPKSKPMAYGGGTGKAARR